MDGPPIEAANKILGDLVAALEVNPVIGDKVRFGMIDFADDAGTVLPLCDIRQLNQLPTLVCRGGTSYAAAFRHLQSEIESDAAQLKADNFQVHRPAVFFVSDGAPTDTEQEWRAAFAALTSFDKGTGQGFRAFPNIVPFGVGEADAKMMAELIHPKGDANDNSKKKMKLFMASEETSVADALRAVAEILVSSVVQSAQNVGEGGDAMVLPEDDKLPEGVNAGAYEDWI
jgi:uncharacterized protein YegL